MKSAKLAIAVLACLPLYAAAQDMVERPDKGALFETILEYVDETTATELQASRDDLTALHDEVQALRDSDEVDEEVLQEAVASLRAGHRELREDVREVIDGNEDLQAALEEARGDFAGEAREGHRGRRPRRGEIQ
ncbi:MAG: hypothetical protein O7F73_21230 [Gammaproteobacteria bacterium]|nr:hypothetical protein [Gammaproteobacteria bacterium]